MKVINQEVYDDWKDKNTDPYSAAIFRYAENWANLMEAAMEVGKGIEDIAEDCERRADIEGYTGFQFGAARSILFHCWIHGKELEQYYLEKGR